MRRPSADQVVHFHYASSIGREETSLKSRGECSKILTAHRLENTCQVRIHETVTVERLLLRGIKDV